MLLVLLWILDINCQGCSFRILLHLIFCEHMTRKHCLFNQRGLPIKSMLSQIAHIMMGIKKLTAVDKPLTDVVSEDNCPPPPIDFMKDMYCSTTYAQESLFPNWAILVLVFFWQAVLNWIKGTQSLILATAQLCPYRIQRRPWDYAKIFLSNTFHGKSIVLYDIIISCTLISHAKLQS